MTLRFPSIAIALQRARETLRRFPLAILAALGAMAVVFQMIDGPNRDWHPRLLATLVLGLVLFTTSVTAAERRLTPVRRRWVADGLIALALALLYRASLGWPDKLAVLRFLQLLLVGHLFAAVAPYVAPGGLRGFWQFNRFLFLRFLVATLYALVLWVGLAVALASIDKLFGVKVPSERYAQLMTLLAFGFHPWFFLSGVPRDYGRLEELEDYPTGLKVFTQYVLIPLVAIYLVILTAYLGKVLITRSWPSGWIGYLVSSVSLTGVLALLLVHPIRQREDSRWVKAYGRWWFVALLPALAMLLLAVAKRMGQYGVTEPRYFLLVLAVWLLGLALYYIWSGSDNIKLIPVSLGLVAALTALGPWGAYAVSQRSQTARLGRILAANRMGTIGAPVRTTGVVGFEDRRELSAILRYLEETHGPGSVARVMGVPTDSVLAWKRSDQSGSDSPIVARAVGRLGIAYINRWEGRQRGGASDSFWANYTPPHGLEVTGFDVTREMFYPALGWIGSAVDSLQLTREAGTTVVVWHDGAVAFKLDLGAAIHAALPEDSLTRRGSGPLAAPIVVEATGGGLRVRWVLHQVGGRVAAGRLELQSANGPLLVTGLRGSSPQ
jgi:hypothetical protein